MRAPLVVLPLLAACSGATREDTDAFSGGQISASCEQYLACAEIAAEDSFATLTVTLGPDSPCWDSEDEAALCTASCIDGLLVASKTEFGRDEVCWVDGKPNMYGVFGPMGQDWLWALDEDATDDVCEPFGYELDSSFVAEESGLAFTFEIFGSGWDDEVDCMVDTYAFSCAEGDVVGTFNVGFESGDMTIAFVLADATCAYSGEAY